MSAHVCIYENWRTLGYVEVTNYLNNYQVDFLNNSTYLEGRIKQTFF
jgi:hypothetical protein